MRSLTDQQVLEIRQLYGQSGITQEKLAEKYKCSVFTISIWLDPNPERRKKEFTYKIYRKISNVCKCGVTYKAHKRCPICTQLFHGECDCKNDKPYFSQDPNNFL